MQQIRKQTDIEYLLRNWEGIFSRMKAFRPLVLAGGRMIPQVLPLLEGHGVEPDFILPTESIDLQKLGIELTEFESLDYMPGSAGICVCSLLGVDLAQQIEKYTHAPILDAFLPLGNPMFASHFDPRTIADSVTRIGLARDVFNDEESQEVFDRIIAFRLTYDLRLVPQTETIQYYHPETTPVPGDVIIDAGAYDGDSALSFAASTNNRVRIYSFEPDKNNLILLQRNIRMNRLDRTIRVIPKALWREDGQVSFSGTGVGAHIGSEGERVQTMALDTLFFSEKVKPTLVKMDIEGSEIDALKGAGETIRSCRPRLAISAYHCPDDLWEIPLLTAQLRPNSTFSLMRHHSPESLAEIVCYVYS